MGSVLLPSGVPIHIAIFSRPHELATGLMGIPSMPRDHGALFIHPQALHWRYHTFGCLFPIDIAWMDQSGLILYICEAVPPGNYTGKPPYPALYVLEVNGGVLAENGACAGSTLGLQF